jgi:hypothetical protein
VRPSERRDIFGQTVKNLMMERLLLYLSVIFTAENAALTRRRTENVP